MHYSFNPGNNLIIILILILLTSSLEMRITTVSRIIQLVHDTAINEVTEPGLKIPASLKQPPEGC